MSTHDPTPEERELQALFDATAEEPSPDTLHRLARVAAQIPETRKAPSPVLLWLRRLVPVVGIAAAAAAGWFLLAGEGSENGPPQTPSLGESPRTAMTASPPGDDEGKDDGDVLPILDDEDVDAVLALLDVPVETDDLLDDASDDPVAALDLTPSSGDPFDALDALFPAEGDESVDLYGDLLEELLQEDG